MSLGHLNYDALLEEFCVWYFRVNHKLPNKSTVFSKKSLIRYIWALRREHSKYEKSPSKTATFKVHTKGEVT